MKILICGGHLTPALGVIHALPKGTEILYVGRKYAMEGDNALSLEYQTITKLGIPFEKITTGRLQRHISVHSLSLFTKLPKGFLEAHTIITNFKPDVIVGFGSYVALPLCVVGAFLHIPIIIHEQTLKTGLTNKILASVATNICISFPSSARFFPKEKTILTGNPALSTIIQQSEKEKKKNSTPILVIVGGSQGSHAINILIEGCIEKLLKTFSIIHQTGDAKQFGDYDRLMHRRENMQKELQKKYTLEKFINANDIQTIYEKADMVISRAGINTVLTLLWLQKPTLFIPLPSGQTQEQQTNAQYFVDKGLGEMVDQESLTSEKLYKKIMTFYEQRHLYTFHGNSEEISIHKYAAKKIVDMILLCKRT